MKGSSQLESQDAACAICGNALEADAAYCSECGSPRRSETVARAAPEKARFREARSEGRDREAAATTTPFWRFAVVGAVGVAVGALLVVLGSFLGQGNRTGGSVPAESAVTAKKDSDLQPPSATKRVIDNDAPDRAKSAAGHTAAATVAPGSLGVMPMAAATDVDKVGGMPTATAADVDKGRTSELSRALAVEQLAKFLYTKRVSRLELSADGISRAVRDGILEPTTSGWPVTHKFVVARLGGLIPLLKSNSVTIDVDQVNYIELKDPVPIVPEIVRIDDGASSDVRIVEFIASPKLPEAVRPIADYVSAPKRQRLQLTMRDGLWKVEPVGLARAGSSAVSSVAGVPPPQQRDRVDSSPATKGASSRSSEVRDQDALLFKPKQGG